MPPPPYLQPLKPLATETAEMKKGTHEPPLELQYLSVNPSTTFIKQEAVVQILLPRQRTNCLSPLSTRIAIHTPALKCHRPYLVVISLHLLQCRRAPSQSPLTTFVFFLRDPSLLPSTSTSSAPSSTLNDFDLHISVFRCPVPPPHLLLFLVSPLHLLLFLGSSPPANFFGPPPSLQERVEGCT